VLRYYLGKVKKNIKRLLAILVLVLTLGIFVYYFLHHPELWQRLGEVPPLTITLLFVLYLCFTVSIALILLATVSLCNVRISLKDGTLLTMWSSIINFFGPLQSGPAFRAVYLKKVHNVSLKTYGLATLWYYAFFAMFSGLFLISGLVPWYVLLILIGLAGAAGVVLLRSNLKLAQRLRTLPLKDTYKLALATLLQVVLTATIYCIELRAVDASISIHQAIVYTGAANFALFVSITPGAIGFREAFLVFSQSLHHISPATIVATNVIDRATYVILLGVLFVVAISIHAQTRLGVKKS
jgi:uncharacterized membrane protein YbhN (UPF0104 family)